MTLFAALLLGLVQGLTEFFPVSSSAHLLIVKRLIGIKETYPLFDLSCHMGTLLSLLRFYYREMTTQLRLDRTKILHLTLATAPLIPSYLLLSRVNTLLNSPYYLGMFLMASGGILWAGQTFRVQKRGGLLRDLLLIGMAQSCALIPGISRSGSTIACAQVLGWDRREAVHFSFLLAIPTIVGGNLVKMHNLAQSGQLLQSFGLEIFVGFFAALLVGLAAVGCAIRILENINLSHFAWYCLAIGALAHITIFVTA